MNGFLMEEKKIILVIVTLTIKDSSNFNKGKIDYDGILNGKIPDYSCYCNANNQRLPKFQQRKRKLWGNS